VSKVLCCADKTNEIVLQNVPHLSRSWTVHVKWSVMTHLLVSVLKYSLGSWIWQQML